MECRPCANNVSNAVAITRSSSRRKPGRSDAKAFLGFQVHCSGRRIARDVCERRPRQASLRHVTKTAGNCGKWKNFRTRTCPRNEKRCGRDRPMKGRNGSSVDLPGESQLTNSPGSRDNILCQCGENRVRRLRRAARFSHAALTPTLTSARVPASRPLNLSP